MMSLRKYILQKTEKSFCPNPNCGSLVTLFCPRNFNGAEPAYYLCFGCGYIGRVGIGPVTGMEQDHIIELGDACQQAYDVLNDAKDRDDLDIVAQAAEEAMSYLRNVLE